MYVVNKHFRCPTPKMLVFASTHVITETISTEMALCRFWCLKVKQVFYSELFCLGPLSFWSFTSILIWNCWCPLRSRHQWGLLVFGWCSVPLGNTMANTARLEWQSKEPMRVLLSACLSGDQMLPKLGPSLNANGHLLEVKERFWLS